MKQSKIEWTESTWNPLRGCTRVSPGCRNCYAERVADRFSGPGQPYEGLTTRGKDGQPRWNGEVMLAEHKLNDPLKWKKPRRIFVNSMSDLFHEKVSVYYIQKVFRVMRQANWHQFQILTKRAKRLMELSPYIDWPRNVWMGVSIENASVLERVEQLCRTRAAIRFLSIEPLIDEIVDIRIDDIDWVIVGGESGPQARWMHPSWAIHLRYQCVVAGVPFFMKQMGSHWAKSRGSKSWKGDDFSEFPDALQVREYPKGV